MSVLYDYIECSGDTLKPPHPSATMPIMWAQEGRYGWISREQVQNWLRRIRDLAKQQKGYAKDKPLDLVFHWGDTTPLDPITVQLMREVIEETKKCLMCTQILPISEFRRNQSAIDGLNISCRKCEDLQDEDYLASII